jgi:hypothetical protein
MNSGMFLFYVIVGIDLRLKFVMIIINNGLLLVKPMMLQMQFKGLVLDNH